MDFVPFGPVLALNLTAVQVLPTSLPPSHKVEVVGPGGNVIIGVGGETIQPVE
jgi:hypothetical protein